MKTVYTANPYIGEVVVPLVPNKKCHDNMMLSFEGAGQNYHIIQSRMNDDGAWVRIPPNDVRILTRDLFVTSVSLGYYKFEIYGAKP